MDISTNLVPSVNSVLHDSGLIRSIDSDYRPESLWSGQITTHPEHPEYVLYYSNCDEMRLKIMTCLLQRNEKVFNDVFDDSEKVRELYYEDDFSEYEATDGEPWQDGCEVDLPF